MDYKAILAHYAEGIDNQYLFDEAVMLLEACFERMNKEELMHHSRHLALAYLALKQVEDARPKKTGTTIRRNWCRNIGEIGCYLSGGHSFPGVEDDIQEKWEALENAESIISISWDAKEEAYLVVFRQRIQE